MSKNSTGFKDLVTTYLEMSAKRSVIKLSIFVRLGLSGNK